MDKVTLMCEVQASSDIVMCEVQAPSDTVMCEVQGPSDTVMCEVQGPIDTVMCEVQGPSDTVDGLFNATANVIHSRGRRRHYLTAVLRSTQPSVLPNLVQMFMGKTSESRLIAALKQHYRHTA